MLAELSWWSEKSLLWRWGLDWRNRCLDHPSNKATSNVWTKRNLRLKNAWWTWGFKELVSKMMTLFVNWSLRAPMIICSSLPKGVSIVRKVMDSRIWPDSQRIANRQPLKIGRRWIDSNHYQCGVRSQWRSISLLYDATRFSQTTNVAEFSNIRQNGLKALNLRDEDELINASLQTAIPTLLSVPSMVILSALMRL